MWRVPPPGPPAAAICHSPPTVGGQQPAEQVDVGDDRGVRPVSLMHLGSAADGGMVSAETAAVLPVLVVVLALLLWGLAVGVMQARCATAARGAALATARGEDERSVTDHVRRALGERSRVTVRRGGDEVRVVVTSRVGGVRWLPARTVSATAHAAVEPGATP